INDILVTEHDDKKALSVDRAAIDLSVQDIFSKKIIAESIHLIDASLYLKKYSDHLSLYTLMKNDLKKETAANKKRNSWEILSPYISLVNLSIMLEGDKIPKHVYFAKIEQVEIDDLLIKL